MSKHAAVQIRGKLDSLFRMRTSCEDEPEAIWRPAALPVALKMSVVRTTGG
jgi:hypothetical protein